MNTTSTCGNLAMARQGARGNFLGPRLEDYKKSKWVSKGFTNPKEGGQI